MQWDLFTRCSTESAWWLMMWQQFRETVICKLSLIIKARTETSIPGLKPVSLWYCRGRQDQEFKAFLSSGSQVQLYTSAIHKDGQSISLKLPLQADCISREEPVAPSLSLLPSLFRNLVLCTIINATCASELLSSSQETERFQHWICTDWLWTQKKARELGSFHCSLKTPCANSSGACKCSVM